MKSMTGFSSVSVEADGTTYSIEIKTVNQRYRDYSFRMPDHYMDLEEKFRNKINQVIHRGKIQVFLRVDEDKKEGFEIRQGSLGHIYQEMIGKGKPYDLPAPQWKDLLLLKDYFVNQDQMERDPNQERLILDLLDQALGQLVRLRLVEGQRTFEDLEACLKLMKETLGQVEALSDEIEAVYREKLFARMKEVLNSSPINEERILLEAAIYAEKADVHEEIQRLGSHVQSFAHMMREAGPIGRKLDFLAQEMNREANTICSKINDASIVRLGVELKSLVEKIREQVQNIE